MINVRQKGHRFEREIAVRFRDAGFPDARRGHQERRGSDEGDVTGCSPFWIECKRERKTSPRAALAQANEAAGKNAERLYVLAVCKDDHGPVTVTMSLDDFLEIQNALIVEGAIRPQVLSDTGR